MSGLRIALAAGALAAAGAVTAFIGPWEGTKLDSYRDIVGVWTVCDGVTGPAAGPGKSYTQAQCDALTTDAVARHLRGLDVCIHPELPQHQWVALGSWAYNIGVNGACKSTLVKQVNAGLPPEVWCKQLLRWDRAGGKRVRGLTRRRAAEYSVCIGES